jgi:hypothetical protein
MMATMTLTITSLLNTGIEYPLTYFINLSWLKSQVFMVPKVPLGGGNKAT